MLFRSYVGRGSDLGEWLSDAQINRDSNLRLQYLAGLAPDQQVADEVVAGMVQHMRAAQAIQYVGGTASETPAVVPAGPFITQ